MIQRFFHLDLTRTEDRNTWYLVAEIFWAAILSGAVNFNGAFVIRLGASNTAIGLLSSIPALLTVLLSIPSARFLEARTRRKPWLLGALMVYRFGFLLMALVPWLNIKAISPGMLVVCVLIAMSIPVIFFNVGFTAMLADIIPENRRVAVFSARNMIASATLSVCVFLFGQWLSRIIFPLNYQILLIFGFAISLLSNYNLLKIQVPDSITKPPPPPGKHSIQERWGVFRQAFTDHPVFVRLTINTFMYSMGMWIATPLYVLYYLRTLQATDAWLGILGSVSSLCVIAGFALWRWLIPRLGEALTLKITIVTMGLLPLMVGLSPSLTPILFVVGLNGLLSPGVSLAHLNTLLKVMPETSRTQYYAVYAAICNAGVFVCPLIGVSIANQVGLAPTLIGCGMLAIIGACSFWIWPIREISR